MISATYFGEITELDSRAVWYSDEEDDDDDEDELEIKTLKPQLKPIEPANHEIIRANIHINFTKLVSFSDIKFKTCVLSLSSSTQFKNFKLANSESLQLLGHFDDFGRAFALPFDNNQQSLDPLAANNEYYLWLLFDSSSDYISGYQVGYFVELLRDKLNVEFGLNHTHQIFILSKQFSTGEHLEYLTNCNIATQMKLPFSGYPAQPPSLIKSQFESALFEQLTLSLNPALIVCLPSPRNFWFDKTKNWPSIPKQIIEHKLNDDNLDKTLIFT